MSRMRVQAGDGQSAKNLSFCTLSSFIMDFDFFHFTFPSSYLPNIILHLVNTPLSFEGEGDKGGEVDNHFLNLKSICKLSAKLLIASLTSLALSLISVASATLVPTSTGASLSLSNGIS